MNSFGEIIKLHRTNLGLPLRKVAAALDIDTSILSKIERGQRSASRDLISKTSDYFNINELELLTHYLSDQIAQSIYKEDGYLDILKVAEEKVKYLKDHNSAKK